MATGHSVGTRGCPCCPREQQCLTPRCVVAHALQGGVSVCLAYPGFGAPFVCLGFARPCFSSQGCECHRRLCQALDLRLGPVVHTEGFLWSPRRSGVKIRRKMARLCSSFRRAPWPVPRLRLWLLRAAGLLFVPFSLCAWLAFVADVAPTGLPRTSAVAGNASIHPAASWGGGASPCP